MESEPTHWIVKLTESERLELWSLLTGVIYAAFSKDRLQHAHNAIDELDGIRERVKQILFADSKLEEPHEK